MDPTPHSIVWGATVAAPVFIVTAAATEAQMDGLDSPESAQTIIQLAFDAVSRGDARVVAALAAVGSVWALRRWGAQHLPWLATDRGGAVLSLAVGVAGSVLHGLAAGQGVSADLVWQGVQTALAASGLWTVGRKLAKPAQSGEVKP
jgi:hypothetical protein